MIKRCNHAPNVGQIHRLSFDALQQPGLTRYLLINRSLSSELLDMLYSSNTFTLNDPWLIETFIVRVGTSNLKRIAHLEVQGGSLGKSNNTKTENTLFSIISAYFSNLLTLRVVGIGRGKMRDGGFCSKLWLPAHLERLEFLMSLPGVLEDARVYCDKDENNSRLLCNGAEYKTEWDELEADMQNARQDMKKGRKEVKKRKASGNGISIGPGPSKIEQKRSTTKEGPQRKKPKTLPPYEWRS